MNLVTIKINEELLESLSQLEHQQWMSWAKTMLETEKISEQRKLQWESYFVPYHQLPENIKELDRNYARKVIALLKKAIKPVD